MELLNILNWCILTNMAKYINIGDSIYSLTVAPGGNIILNAGSTGHITLDTASTGTISINGNIISSSGVTTINNNLNVTGAVSFSAPVAISTATYTQDTTDDTTLIIGNTAVVLTLVPASSNTGKILWVTNTSANTVTSATSNVTPLGSNTPGTAILAATNGKFAMLQSDGTYWRTIMAN